MATLAPVRTTLLCLLALSAAAQAQAEGNCQARSAATATRVVELYTSEGCSSCPPADRWLSRFGPESPVVALAFHVDYWNRLGWKDRFASPAFTQRQSLQQASNGARFSYTPQVVLDGVDRPDWPGLATPAPGRPAAVELGLVHEGGAYRATVSAAAGAPPRLAAYWAVTEDGHASAVKAGENQGATLRHDHVVREYLPVTAWAASVGAPVVLRFEPSSSADAGHARQVNLVVVDASTGRPVQALKLGC